MRKLAVLLLLALCLVSYAHAEEYQTFEAKYLVMDVPKGWTKVEKDNGTNFYADANHTADNGVLMIFENESTPYMDTLAPLMYQEYFNSLNSDSKINDLSMEPVKICNQDAAYFMYTMDSVPFHLGVYVMPSKGYIISILYTHPKENQNAKKELMTILNSIRDKASVSAEAKQEEEEFQKCETEYFTLDVPAGWTKVTNNDGIYFYENYAMGASDGYGVLTISETTSSPTVDWLKPLLYKTIITALEGRAGISDIRYDNMIIAGQDAIYANYKQEINNVSLNMHMAMIALPSEGYNISIMYSHENGGNAKYEFFELLHKIKYKGDVSSKESVYKSGLEHDFGAVAVSIIGHKMIKQGDQDCLVVEYQWTHQGDEPTAFAYTFETEAYQNGIQCQSKALYDDETEVLTKIQKGAVFTCYDIFPLRDTTSPVTLRIHPFTDFFDQYEPAEYVFRLTD